MSYEGIDLQNSKTKRTHLTGILFYYAVIGSFQLLKQKKLEFEREKSNKKSSQGSKDSRSKYE